MTPAEHADRIHRLLRKSERAQRAVHAALADAVREHGAALGLGDPEMQAAVVPKDPPPNPEREP
jgi:hypothetical protein